MSSHNLVTSKESNEPTVRHLSFTFIPPPWISRIVLHWNLQIQKTLSGLPKISVSLSPLRYNANQKLKAAVTSFDIPGLQRVFREGLARPTDYILQRKPISILEVCWQASIKVNAFNINGRYLLHERISRTTKLLQCTGIYSKKAVAMATPCKSCTLIVQYDDSRSFTDLLRAMLECSYHSPNLPSLS